MHCFFCCKILPKEEICGASDGELDKLDDLNSISQTIDKEDSFKVNDNVKKHSLLQISHYLQLPKHLIPQKEDSDSLYSFCKNCEQVRCKLEELCGVLEVTQLKINYFMNLLTDQILQKDEQLEQHQAVNPSPFQEIFHQKCLTKVATTDCYPVLQLAKCSVRPNENDTEVCTEEPDDYDDQLNPLDAQNDDLIIALEDEQEDDIFIVQNDQHEDEPLMFQNMEEQDEVIIVKQEEQGGPFIVQVNQQKNEPFIIPNDGHSEDEPIIFQKRVIKNLNFPCSLCPLTFSNSRNRQSHIQTVHVRQRSSAGHLIKSCEYCGAMISSRNLSQHKKRAHGVGRQDSVRKYKRCEGCGIRVNTRNTSAHKLICRNDVQSKIAKPKVKCDICGNMISYTNISAHKKNIHGVVPASKIPTGYLASIL